MINNKIYPKIHEEEIINNDLIQKDKIIWKWDLHLTRAENIRRIRKQKIKQILNLYSDYLLFSELN